MDRLDLDYYGIRITITGPRQILLMLRDDHDGFIIPPAQKLNGSLIRVIIDHKTISSPKGKPRFKHKHYSIYYQKEKRILAYPDAVVVGDYSFTRYEVHARDDIVAYEIVHHLLLTTIGLHLDRVGYHRLHAVALEKKGKAALILMDSGMGKSTIAAAFLNAAGYKVISDDLVVCHEGMIFPFVTRIGLREKIAGWEGIVRKRGEKGARTGESDRGEYRYIIPRSMYKKKAADKAIPRLLVSCSGESQKKPAIKQVQKIQMMHELFPHMVLGASIPQGLGYFLTLSLDDMLDKTLIVARRAECMLNLVMKCDCYHFTRVKNISLNISCLKAFLDASLK